MKWLIILCIIFTFTVANESKCSSENIAAIAYKHFHVRKSELGDPHIVKIDHLKDEYNFVIILNTRTTSLCANIVEKLEKVDYLTLNLYNLTKIEQEAFKNGSIKRLVIEATQLREVDKNNFYEMKELEEINLANNKIDWIQQSAFNTLPKLEILRLNNNNLRNVNSSWFVDCPNLWKIDLSFNNILKINRHAFNFLSLDKRHVIYLSYNKIESIEGEAFPSREITTLKLDGNRLEFIFDFNFPKLKYGGILDLTNNRFTCIKRVTEPWLKVFKTILYAENNLRKDCII